MKKSLMLVFAGLMAAFMTGCGGGSSSASSKQNPVNNNNTPVSEVAFDATPDMTSGTNVTYRTTASGDVPPAPPTSAIASVYSKL